MTSSSPTVAVALAPARAPRDRRDGGRLLTLDPGNGRFAERPFTALPDALAPGDLLVVNDAATLPASLLGHDAAGRPVEARLLGPEAPGPEGGGNVFRAVLLGDGDWRQRTEDRPPPPALAPGARLSFGSLHARLQGGPGAHPRLVRLAFEARGDELWEALYRQGRPVQYAYLERALPLWAVQTAYATRPWASEMPSAGQPLSWEILLALRRRGVRWAALTHAAGLSSTGDGALDRALPLPERFDVPQATADLVADTRSRGGRVVAVGTTVVRALEGAAVRGGGTLAAGTGETDLVIGPGFRPRVASAILTGLHAPGESHFALLSAFAPRALLEAAWVYAAGRSLLTHEFGDSMLIAAEGERREAVPTGASGGFGGTKASAASDVPPKQLTGDSMLIARTPEVDASGAA